MSKPGKSLRNLCKKMGVRLTVKRGQKRVYKSVAVLKRQCKRKKKKVKRKVKRKRRFGLIPLGIKAYKKQIGKKWNYENKLKVINSVKKFTLKKGTILYRSQSRECHDFKPLKCSDTGKTGVYFSNGAIIPIGMILEYDNPLYICSYITTEDIDLYWGKYSFRLLEPHRFYKKYYKNPQYLESHDNMIYYIDPTKNYNHVDEALFPDHELFGLEWYKNVKDREYFIGTKDISKVKLLKVEKSKTNQDDAFDIVKKHRESLNI